VKLEKIVDEDSSCHSEQRNGGEDEAKLLQEIDRHEIVV